MILPRKRYLPIIEFDDLLPQQVIYISRRSLLTFEKTFKQLGNNYILREDSIPTLDVLSLSCNLMGGKFKEKHLKFNAKRKGAENWKDHVEIYLFEYLDEYETTTQYCPIYFEVNPIHNVKLPYEREKKDKELTKLLKSLGEQPPESNDKYQFKAEIRIIHVPTNLNYWHVEFSITDFKGDSIEKKGAAWIKKICEQAFRDVLSLNAFHVLPEEISPIPGSAYMKRA